MNKIFVVTNPIPTHNLSPAVSLGKFVALTAKAGADPRVIGARLSSEIAEATDIPSTVKIKSFSYGGSGILKMLSFATLQIKLFFFCLTHFSRTTPVYFWLGDKMIGAFLAAKCRRCEINYFVYGITEGDRSPKWALRLHRFMLGNADHVCAESASVLKQWGTDGDVIPLYCPEFETVPFDEREKKICMLCRLVPEKHPLEAMQAFIDISDDFPDWSLTVIGAGLLLDECQKLARLSDRITVTGWLSQAEVRRILPSFRLLLYPTDTEGVPGSVLEAMASGVVPLASPVGGIPDIADTSCAVFLDDVSDKEISDSLKKALTRSDLCDLSKAAHLRITERFSLDAAAENFMRIRRSREEAK